MFRLSLYLHTLRFTRKSQILYYIRFLFLYRLYRIFGGYIGWLLKGLVPPGIRVRSNLFLSLKKTLLLEIENSEEICKSAENISRRQFLFLNIERNYGQKVAWDDKEMSKLWRYKLHYFDYGMYFAQAYFYTGYEKYYFDFKKLVEEWIKDNPFGQGDGWEPYPISLRVVNWIKNYIFFKDLIKADSEFQILFLKELYLQTLFLEKNLEFHLCGNHLLKNIKALIFSGIFFESGDADRWRKKGLKMLREELKEQILSDGGHFERSPMYHKIVLQDLIETYVLLKDYNRKQDLSWLGEKIRSMYLFLEEILHPDGEIPLFNDSTLDDALKAGVLSRIYNAFFYPTAAMETDGLNIEEFRESGYFIIHDNTGSKAIIDCGRIGPDYIPGHAHCDTLSYELSLNGKRFIVDTGVYEYTIGEKRHYCRSTKAHNTVVVDAQDQSEIWASFRVAQRAYPIYGKVEKVDGFCYFEGAHNGYRRIGVTHRRRVWFEQSGIWIVLDEIEGRGVHDLENFIHFHPLVKANLEEKEIIIEFELEKFRLVPIGESEIDLIKTPYFLEFGRWEERFTITLLAKKANLPYRFGYAIFPDTKGKVYLERAKIIVEVGSDKRIVLQ